jgi:hypothetical protein
MSSLSFAVDRVLTEPEVIQVLAELLHISSDEIADLHSEQGVNEKPDIHVFITVAEMIGEFRTVINVHPQDESVEILVEEEFIASFCHRVDCRALTDGTDFPEWEWLMIDAQGNRFRVFWQSEDDEGGNRVIKILEKLDK